MIGLPGLRGRKVVPQRSADELDAMAAAGALVAKALRAVQQAATPGVSTLDLDTIAESVIREGGGTPHGRQPRPEDHRCRGARRDAEGDR